MLLNQTPWKEHTDIWLTPLSRSLKGKGATAVKESLLISDLVPAVKSTSKKASTSCVVVSAAMPDIAELVNSAELVFMQLTNDRKTCLGGKKFASPPKRAVKFQDLDHHMVMQLILRKADAILLGHILFDYADAQDANNLEICYSTAYIQPGIVMLLFDVEEGGDNYLKCYWFLFQALMAR